MGVEAALLPLLLPPHNGQLYSYTVLLWGALGTTDCHISFH